MAARKYAIAFVCLIAGIQAGAAEKNETLLKYYRQWKSGYLKKGCGAASYYVSVGEGGGGGMEKDSISNSEGQGYGMVAVALMAKQDPDAQGIFDGLLKFARDHRATASPYLMGWNQDKNCESVEDDGVVDTATDGDLDIAYGLLLAHQAWGDEGTIDYLKEARSTIQAIMDLEINQDYWTPKLGAFVSSDDPKYYNAARPSDFMIEHFKAFAKATGDSRWSRVADKALSLLEYTQANLSPDTGLIPDFLVGLNSRVVPAKPDFIEGKTDGFYSYNACRVPLRLAIDFLLTGDSRSLAIIKKLNAWFFDVTEGDPGRILDGYKLDGTLASKKDAGFSMAFAGPLAVSAMAGASGTSDSDIQEWVDSLWETLSDPDMSGEDYYGYTLKLLSMIAFTGNWHSPV